MTVVHVLFFLDTVQTVLIMNDAFNKYVYHFGDYDALLESTFSGTDGPVLDALIAMVVQFVYCWRIWVLSNRKVLPCIIGFVRAIFPINPSIANLTLCHYSFPLCPVLVG